MSEVLFVLPGGHTRADAVEARWLAAASFAESLGRQMGGTAEILTQGGLLPPERVKAEAVHAGGSPGARRRVAGVLPRPARVLLGDLRARRAAALMSKAAGEMPLNGHRLVVQMHRRFQDSGLMVARRLGAPFVLRVEALEVREEAGWGIKRPGWGRVVERRGELRVAGQADLCAAVSQAVDDQLADAGIPDTRRAVIPNGVDLDAFHPGAPDADLRRAHGLEDRFVVGWIGGFRPFHGLDLIPEIARELRARVPQAVLCLVGTGPERDRIAGAVAGMEDVVRLIPAVPPPEAPRWIRAFDACLLLASPGPFHYSPLKMYEYLGCGRPVIAPRIGEPGLRLSDGREGFLVAPQDPGAIVGAVERLARDPELRQRLGSEARRTAERNGSWDFRAEMLLETLRTRGLMPDIRTWPAPGERIAQ